MFLRGWRGSEHIGSDVLSPNLNPGHRMIVLHCRSQVRTANVAAVSNATKRDLSLTASRATLRYVYAAPAQPGWRSNLRAQ